MHECLLCKRDMKTSKDAFGNGCVKNIYSFLGMSMPRKVKSREINLYNNVMKINNVHNINEYQKMWLTDRYLTEQYLNKIPYENYNNLIKQINSDIQNIKHIKNNEKPKSEKNMSLKQAYDLYKKATKFTETINQLKNEKFIGEASIKLFISSCSFIFNMDKNKSQYEKNSFKAMQYTYWQTVIEVGRNYVGFDISADFLQHSLEKTPNDLLIKEGKVINEITKDDNFKENINKIIDEYGKDNNEFIFDSSNDKNYSMTFSEKDLYYSLNNVNMYIKAKKNEEKWNLDVKIQDRYDYTDFKRINKYYKDTKSVPKSILSSTLYNLAWLSIKSKVMKEYDIDIEFKINSDFEVIDK